jgi:hypothetical protein
MRIRILGCHGSEQFQDDATLPQSKSMTSKHLTPTLLGRQISRMNRPDVPVYVYHLKPRWHRTIERQLLELRLPNLTILKEGEEFFSK